MGMESATAVARRPQNMLALEKAMCRKQEIAELKRDLKAGRTTAVQALSDPRAVGAVTLGTVLMAQPQWGRKRTVSFLRHAHIPDHAFAKRVEDLTDRQRRLLAHALLHRGEPLPREMW